MSLCAYDVNGYVGEVASLGGWHELAAWARSVGGALRDLVDHGYTTDPGALAAKLDAQSAEDPTVDATRRNLVKLARAAQDALIIHDGVGSEDELPRTAAGFDANQPRDSHGRWELVSDSHDRAKQAHWEAADWHRKAALNPNLGETAMAATRRAIELTQRAVARDTGATEANDWSQTALDEANIGDHGAAVSAHETAGSLHRERQHKALREMKSAAIGQLRLNAEWQEFIEPQEEAMRLAGSATSGNFGHAGRPGHVGGSAPSATSAKEIVESFGMKYANIQSLPLELREQMHVSRGASGDLTEMQADSLRQLKAALESVGDDWKGVGEFAKQEFQVTAGPYEPDDTLFTTVSGHTQDGKAVGYLAMNTNANIEKMLTEDLAANAWLPSYPIARGLDILKSGGSMPDAVKEVARSGWIHELGHVYDFGANMQMTRYFEHEIASHIPKDLNDSKAWAEFVDWSNKNISGYAADSSQEAAAEAFARAVNNDTLPPELETWKTVLKEK